MNGNSPWAARVPPTTSVDGGWAAVAIAGVANDAAAATAATAVVTFLSRVNQRLGAKGISPSSVHKGSGCRRRPHDYTRCAIPGQPTFFGCFGRLGDFSPTHPANAVGRRA